MKRRIVRSFYGWLFPPVSPTKGNWPLFSDSKTQEGRGECFKHYLTTVLLGKEEIIRSISLVCVGPRWLLAVKHNCASGSCFVIRNHYVIIVLSHSLGRSSFFTCTWLHKRKWFCFCGHVMKMNHIRVFREFIAWQILQAWTTSGVSRISWKTSIPTGSANLFCW